MNQILDSFLCLSKKQTNRFTNTRHSKLDLERVQLIACLVALCKVFENESFHIWSIKHRLITELANKLRDEFIKTN